MGPPVVLGPDATIRITVWARALAAATGVYLASRTKETREYLDAEKQAFLDHIRLVNPEQTPDPGSNNRWRKELQKKLDNMRGAVKRLAKGAQDNANKMIQDLQDMLDQFNPD